MITAASRACCCAQWAFKTAKVLGIDNPNNATRPADEVTE